MEEYYYSNTYAWRLTHQVRLLCLVSFRLLQFPPARHQNESIVSRGPNVMRSLWVIHRSTGQSIIAASPRKMTQKLFGNCIGVRNTINMSHRPIRAFKFATPTPMCNPLSTLQQLIKLEIGLATSRSVLKSPPISTTLPQSLGIQSSNEVSIINRSSAQTSWQKFCKWFQTSIATPILASAEVCTLYYRQNIFN